MIRLSIAVATSLTCSALAIHAADFTGKWEGTVTMPEGQVMHVSYTFAANDGKIGGVVHAGDFGDFAMANIKVEGDVVTFDVPTDDGGYAHTGRLGPDGLSMSVAGPYGEMPPVLCKLAPANVGGVWRGKIEGQNGETEVVFTLAIADGKLTGTVRSTLGEAPLINTSIRGSEVAFDSSYQGYLVKRKGTVDGDTMRLTVNIEGYEIPVTLTRDKTPPPASDPKPAAPVAPASGN